MHSTGSKSQPKSKPSQHIRYFFYCIICILLCSLYEFCSHHLYKLSSVNESYEELSQIEIVKVEENDAESDDSYESIAFHGQLSINLQNTYNTKIPITPQIVIGGRAHAGTTALKTAMIQLNDIKFKRKGDCEYFDQCIVKSRQLFHGYNDITNYLIQRNKLSSNQILLNKYSSLINFSDPLYWDQKWIIDEDYSMEFSSNKAENVTCTSTQMQTTCFGPYFQNSTDKTIYKNTIFLLKVTSYINSPHVQLIFARYFKYTKMICLLRDPLKMIITHLIRYLKNARNNNSLSNEWISNVFVNNRHWRETVIIFKKYSNVTKYEKIHLLYEIASRFNGGATRMSTACNYLTSLSAIKMYQHEKSLNNLAFIQTERLMEETREFSYYLLCWAKTDFYFDIRQDWRVIPPPCS